MEGGGLLRGTPDCCEEHWKWNAPSLKKHWNTSDEEGIGTLRGTVEHAVFEALPELAVRETLPEAPPIFYGSISTRKMDEMIWDDSTWVVARAFTFANFNRI